MAEDDAAKVAADDQAAAAAAAGKTARPPRTVRPSANSVEAEAPHVEAAPCADCLANADRLTVLEARVEQIGKVVGAVVLGAVALYLLGVFTRPHREEVEE